MVVVHTQSDFYNYNILYSNDALALIHFDEWITFPEELPVRFCEEIAMKVAIFIVNIFVYTCIKVSTDASGFAHLSPAITCRFVRFSFPNAMPGSDVAVDLLAITSGRKICRFQACINVGIKHSVEFVYR